MNILVPDYGSGNLASIIRMIEKVGSEARITENPNDLKNASKIVIAGVGAFDHGMRSLNENGWIKNLNEAVLERSVPVLGICLGMQLMCNGSEEGNLAGLGWIEANVKHFDLPRESNLKIPHMGWNTVEIQKQNRLIHDGNDEKRFYFVHSYYVDCNNKEDILATTHHGIDVTAAFCKENIFGVQFHPEKSHKYGMELMENFINL